MKKLYILDIDDTLVYSNFPKPCVDCGLERYYEYLKSKVNPYQHVIDFINNGNPDKIIFITGRSKEVGEDFTIKILEDIGFKDPVIVFMPLDLNKNYSHNKYVNWKINMIRFYISVYHDYEPTIFDDIHSILEPFRDKYNTIWIHDGLIKSCP